MTGSSPADMMSRVPRMPTALWQQDQMLVLQPNETKVLTIPVPAKLPAKSMIGVSLLEAGPATATAEAANPGAQSPRRAGLARGGIVALRFATAVPAVQTASIQ